MSDERLDRLIDDVAKQLTAGQPSSDFRARVIARLDQSPRRAWWASWMAVPLGAVAVAMIALAVARPFMGRDRGAGPRQSSQAVETETAPAAPPPDTTTVRLPPSPPPGGFGGTRPPSPPPGGFGETRKPDTTYGSQQGTRVATAGRRQDPSTGAAAAVAALAPPELYVPPLGVEAIGIEALPSGSIAVPQLDAITPITVEPLPTDVERPASGQPSPNDRNE